MAHPQRILVVHDGAGDLDLARVRDGLHPDPVVLAAPTVEARRVVEAVGAEPQVEVALAPVRFPAADRGHRLDALVRSYALEDRARDVVVVTDAITSTLLLRALAPGQLADTGAVTVVGLPRSDPPIDLRRAAVAGGVLGVLGVLAGRPGPFLVLVAVLAGLGVLLQPVPQGRRTGREVLVASGVAVVVLFLALAGSTRFPATF